MKTIFISIPITGRDQSIVKAESEKAESLAFDMGFRPINPLKIVPGNLTTDPDDIDSWRKAMKICFSELIKSERILIVDVPDRQESKGCLIEENVASVMRLDMYYTNQDISNIDKSIPGKWAPSHSASLLNG